MLRMGDKSTGSGFMLEKYEQNFQLDPNVHVPFNYLEILKPKSKEEIEALFNQGNEDPFNSQQNSTQSDAAWGAQKPVQSWGSKAQGESRVFGATSSSGGSDPIPF